MRENWKYSTIGESCNINYGTRVVRKRDGGSIYDVYGGGGATFKMDTYNREDCLVVSRFAMSPKCTRFVSGKFFLNDSGLTLSPKKDTGLSQAFMNTILLANNDNIYKYGRGSAQRNLKVDEFCTMPISYPKSLTEQERIVALLDDQFAKIDALKANAASQLQAAKDLFQSALKEMLTPKEGWEMKKVGDCFISINNGANIKQTKGAGGIPITRIETLSNGVFNVDRLGYANIDDTSRYSKYILKDGDLLMSHINSVEFVGRTVVYHDQLPIVIHGMNLLRLVPNTTAISDFYYYAFKAPWFRSQLEPIIHKSVNQASMNTTALKQVNIYIPNKEEQRKIVSRLDAISEKVKALQANYDQTITLCNDLKQSLLKSIFA